MRQYIDRSRMRQIIPAWAAPVDDLAVTLEGMLTTWLEGRSLDAGRLLDFWVEADNDHVRVAQPNGDGVDLCGHLIINNAINPLGSPCQLSVPLNDVLSGVPAPRGEHGVYIHSIATQTPLTYVGITKQTWNARFSQHLSCARTGSPYVFHRALAQLSHRLVLFGVDYATAMEIEQEYVEFTLYPKGLNMIPGGFAGLKYLSTLGVTAASAKQRDAAIERLAKLPQVKGKPNPLCAARWQADQDYINRVICGHGDRLTVEQVRQVRLLADFGRDPGAILSAVGAKNTRQVQNVLAGKHYGRVA